MPSVHLRAFLISLGVQLIDAAALPRFATLPRYANISGFPAYDPNANKGICECPLAGPTGSCLIKPMDYTDPSASWSAQCEGEGFYYTCGGSYDQPNCNLCAQAYPLNAAPTDSIIDCPGMKWCSDDKGNNWHRCGIDEEPFHSLHIVLEIGSTTMDIGDYDTTQLPSVFTSVCGPNGCDAGSAQPLSFHNAGIASAGRIIPTSGTVQIEGNVNQDQHMIDNLVSTVTAALSTSKQCNTQKAQKCLGSKVKRETPGIAMDCWMEDFTTCTMANFVQATVYDQHSTQYGQLTFNGESTSLDFDCDTFLGLMGAAATGLDLNPVVQGAVAFGSVICSSIKG